MDCVFSKHACVNTFNITSEDNHEKKIRNDRPGILSLMWILQ